jgi:2-oxoglutarate dehydrogenase E2 component (dihydrolipoamide succinyltransferase)
MPVSVTMPRLGESVTEGTVTRWLKQEGERVEVDEPLLEVSTDKVDTEIPSPAAGVLSRIVVREDETVDVGSELAVIDSDGGSSDGSSKAPPESSEASSEASSAAQPAEASSAAQPAEARSEQRQPEARQAPAQQAQPRPAEAQQAQAPPSDAEVKGAAEAAEPTTKRESGGADRAGTPVTMPALGESVTEGTVTRWLKQVGDTVAADEPLLEVSTDKVDTEIPSPVAGVVLEITVAEDEVVPVGAQLALVGAEGGGSGSGPAASAPQSAPQPSASPPAEPQRSAPQPAEAQQSEGQRSAPQPAGAQEAGAQQTGAQRSARSEPGDEGERGNGYVTPLVRKLASEHGVDLTSLTGTGVGGRIRKQDVLAAAEKAREAEQSRLAEREKPAAAPTAKAPAAAPSPLRGRTEKLSRLRAVIAKRMVESLHVSAQLTTVVEVDVSRIARLRDQAKAEFQRRHGVKLSFLPFFVLATVEALRVHPILNASLDQEAGTVTYHDAEHLGIAVDTERGLVVPVIRDAGDLNLAGLAKRIADLAERTRTNKISPDELSGGTFTLTNTGSRGALFDTPIINQPQVGILGTGTVVKRPVVVSDTDLGEIVATRSMVYLALSYDHRLVDGADAARFLATLKERLEAGSFDHELGL